MEKKTYLTPQMRLRDLFEDLLPLCSSKIRGQGTGGVDVDLGYGGVDDGGTIEPSAKKRFGDYDGLDDTDDWLL
jgi:hypothetical protein